MVTATAQNAGTLLRGEGPKAVGTWNAVSLADFGDSRSRRATSTGLTGKWMQAAKIGFETYSLRKIRQGQSEIFFERLARDVLGISRLKDIHEEVA